ncbi:MAG TPA: DUF4142 domain-containing protein [Lacipirellulaceae bacterium]|jgi:putative membrane protein
MNRVRIVAILAWAALASLIAVSDSYAQQMQGSPGAHPLPNRDNSTGTTERIRQDQTGTQGTTTDAQRMRGQNQEQNLDHVLAACLLTGNQGEVELGKLASERASDRDVKAFAEEMVKDHSKQVQTLQQFIGSQQPSDQRSQIERQIAERCTADLKKELEGKSGREFDDCYIGAQIGGHMHMQAALAVISEHASGQLRDIVKDAQPTVDKHLDRAKKLMEQLDKSTSSGRQASKQSSSER